MTGDLELSDLKSHLYHVTAMAKCDVDTEILSDLQIYTLQQNKITYCQYSNIS